MKDAQNYTALEQLLDEVIEKYPDQAERLLEKHLARLQLKKRLTAYKEAKRARKSLQISV
jgi:hypothetical protein